MSDHDGVRFRIKVGREEIGGGMWILNAAYIEEDEYKQQIRELLEWKTEKVKNTKKTIWQTLILGRDGRKLRIESKQKRRRKMMRKEKELRERLRVELSKAEN